MTVDLDTIRQAIHEQRRLQFTYNRRNRVVLPMALGIGHKGSWQLRAQQVGGASSSGTVGDDTPKLFDVAQMEHLSIGVEAFSVPAAFRVNDTAFKVIDSQLDV